MKRPTEDFTHPDRLFVASSATMAMKNPFQPMSRAAGALLIALTAACGGDGDGDPIDRDDSGLSDARVDDAAGGDAAVDAGPAADGSQPQQDSGSDGGGSDAGSSDGGGGDSLFTSTPDCAPGGAGSARVRLTGSMGTFSVDYDVSAVTSNLLNGALDSIEFEGTTQIRPINLRWQGGLQPGELHALTGNSLVLPDQSTGGAGPHCVVAGEIASTPAAQKPSTGALIHFRISKVRKRTARDNTGMCDGPELDATLVGCMYRTNASLPPN